MFKKNKNKPKIEKIEVKGTWTKNQKKIVNKINEIIYVLNRGEK